MARNNNRPRTNNRSRNLSSFIPQPRTSIVDDNRPTWNMGGREEELLRFRERHLEQMREYFNNNSTRPAFTSYGMAILDLSEESNSNPTTFYPGISEQVMNVSMGNGTNMWTHRNEFEAYVRIFQQASEDVMRNMYNQDRPLEPDEVYPQTDFQGMSPSSYPGPEISDPSRLTSHDGDFQWEMLGTQRPISNNLESLRALIRVFPNNQTYRIGTTTYFRIEETYQGDNGEIYKMVDGELQLVAHSYREETNMSSTAPVQSIPDNDSTQFNRPFTVRDRNGNLMHPDEPRSLLESRREQQRLATEALALINSPIITEEAAPFNPRFTREDIERVVRRFTDELPSDINDIPAYLEARRRFSRARRPIDYSSPFIYGTSGEIPEVPIGERFDNIIIIEQEHPMFLEQFGWGRGYVLISKNNLLYTMPTEQIKSILEVHGGITFCSTINERNIESNWSKSLQLTEEDIDKMIVGFDTSHYNSKALFPDKESVLEETMQLQLQIAAY